MNEANFNPDVIEAALAHTDKNEYEELIIAQHI